MPDLSVLSTPGPYHIITYGTLLGTQVYQSFIAGVVGYKVLSRPQFSSLQQAIFPVYFSLQSALPVALALTYPGERSPLGAASSLSGVFAESNRWSTLAPLLTIFGTSVLNLVVVGPLTTKIMKERKHQETRDGKKSYDAPPHSKEMTALNKRFGRTHGVSSLLNLAGLIATIVYGVTISNRIV